MTISLAPFEDGYVAIAVVGSVFLRDTEDGVQKALDYLTKENWWQFGYRSPAEQKAWYLEHPDI
jgi:hypothetical protein